MVSKIIHWVIRLFLVIAVGYGIMAVVELKFEDLKTKERNVKFITMSEREKQLTCLSKNIYFEAGYEPFEGKVAVAQVTLNRVNSGKFPSDVCEVVYQKTARVDKVICQFSWYCEPGPKAPVNNKAYIESQEVAKKVLLEGFRLPSLHNAMFYHATYIQPNWNLPKIATIGQHIFYGERQ